MQHFQRHRCRFCGSAMPSNKTRCTGDAAWTTVGSNSLSNEQKSIYIPIAIAVKKFEWQLHTVLSAWHGTFLGQAQGKS